ncbi:hypothetical protein [Halomicronema hongdechloris]|uniref:hypothetical protein n=1 Tax=Halomicronema hongdechloris TaxID=1209493 RepID=UPI0016513389|nr:hypothetical protein [Halomicronema hongdechloris]
MSSGAGSVGLLEPHCCAAAIAVPALSPLQRLIYGITMELLGIGIVIFATRAAMGV